MTYQDRIRNFGFRGGPCERHVCNNNGDDDEAIDLVAAHKKPLCSFNDFYLPHAKKVGLVIKPHGKVDKFFYGYMKGVHLRDFWDVDKTRAAYMNADLEPPSYDVFNMSMNQILDIVKIEQNFRVMGLAYGFPLESTIRRLFERDESARFSAGAYTCQTCGNKVNMHCDNSDDSEPDFE